jgi:hypothetical protein
MHDIHTKDLRPLGSKNTKICLKCGCSGKKLRKYKDCESYHNSFKESL